MGDVIPSINDLKKINGDRFNAADYVNFLSNISSRPQDLVKTFFAMIFPSISIIDDLPFNEEIGAYQRFIDNIDKGMQKMEAYYWSHVTDVEGLLMVGRSDADGIADGMSIGWNSSLKRAGIRNIYFRKVMGEEIILEPVIDVLREV